MVGCEPFHQLPSRESTLAVERTGFLPHSYVLPETQEVQRDTHTYVTLLRACTKLKDVHKGFEIHAKVAKLGLLDKDPFVGTTLVDMYAKCGLLFKAQEVFMLLSVRDVVSWNALISGYAENGHGKEALKLLERMGLEGMLWSTVTCVCGLKACIHLQELDKGKEIHARLENCGLLQHDIILGNTLVDMYAKCGSLDLAKHFLINLQARDTFTWTSLLAGYVHHGHGDKALECFEQMQLEGIAPNTVTYICSLKACASTRNLEKGGAIYTQIVTRGLFERDLAVGNSLVDMYVKCGSLVAAKEVFDEMRERDVVSWTALIMGYLESGHCEKALELFDQMQLEGICPNTVTMVGCLRACCTIGAHGKGQEIHAQMEQKEVRERDPVVGTALVKMYAKGGSLATAQKVFDRLRVRDRVLWTALIGGYAGHGQGEKALDSLQQMQAEGISPDVVTFICSLQACGSIGAADKGQEIHVEIERQGLLVDNPLVGNSLVDMYARCCLLDLAHDVLNKLPVRDENTWNSLIGGYAHLGNNEDVLLMLECMLEDHVMPDLVTFISLLKTCSRTGMSSRSLSYFEAMSKCFGIVATLEHHNTMIDLHCRSGLVDQAVAMARKLALSPNLIMSRTLLSACRSYGNVDIATQLLGL